MTDSLRDIINEAMLTPEDPETQDTLEDNETEDTAAEAVSDEPLDSEDNEVDETEDDTTDVEELEGANDIYKVRVDGETVDVTLKEALAGYQRQADYTRKAQALAQERHKFEQTQTEVQEAVESVQSLDEAWNNNPVSVLAHFTASTDNPTQAVALLIKELAASNLLEKEFLDIFGITGDTQLEWQQQQEVDNLRHKVSKTEQQEESRAMAQQTEYAVQQAIVQFEKDIDDILSDEGIKLSSVKRAEFRQQLASYARDNELTNIKAAYKALKYEEQSTKRNVASKTAERAKAKRSTSAVARKGSSGSDANSVAGAPKDLRSVILESMKENGG